MTLRIVGALVFAAAIVGLFPATAAASCLQTTVAQSAALAEVVVYGTVTETRQTFAPASGVIRFQPQRFLKGTLPGEVEVFLGPTKGGPITSVDYEAVVRGGGDLAATHTLYLRAAGNGAWQTDACSGSHVGAPTPEENTFFGTGTSAPPAAPINNVPFVIAAVALAAIALAALSVARRYAGPSTLTKTSP
jgi:hypothetical protein